MQERVRQFLLRNGIECGAEYRCLDLASEVGEVAKEILRGSSYGKEPYAPTPETEEELGDCLFSLLALCCALNAALHFLSYRAKIGANVYQTRSECVRWHRKNSASA